MWPSFGSEVVPPEVHTAGLPAVSFRKCQGPSRPSRDFGVRAALSAPVARDTVSLQLFHFCVKRQ
jgi:hypothetical protein